MPCLPPHPDLDQLRRQAKDLLRAAQHGDTDAVARVHAVSDHLILDSAQLAVAREYGFASWATVKTEVTRREIFDARDVARLNSLLAEHPELAVEPMLSWCDHPQGASPLGYVAMLRYDTSRVIWRDVPGTAAIARALLKAGAPADGDPADAETPLMTAASYGDAEVAQALIEAGADLAATASVDAGGVPGGTALRHAAVFGMADVAQVLLAAGATDLVQAAAAGRADSVRHLLTHGADPGRRDTRFGGTPLGWCRHRRDETGPGHGHEEVEQLPAQRAPTGIPWPQNLVALSGGVVRDSRGAAPCVQTTVIHRPRRQRTAGLERDRRPRRPTCC